MYRLGTIPPIRSGETDMDIQEIRDAIEATEAQLARLSERAESGEQWAEICRIEADELVPLKADLAQWIEDNGQFGVGA